jgi:hypothetical protein
VPDSAVAGRYDRLVLQRRERKKVPVRTVARMRDVIFVM